MNSPANPTSAIQGLVALIQLGRRAREAATAEELAFIAVNETRGLFQYRQAALWLAGDARHVAAVSGVAQTDPSAPYMQWLERLFKACGGAAGEPRRLCAGDLPAVTGEEWGQWLPRDALLIPLIGPAAGTVGTLLLVREGAWRDEEAELAAEVGRIYGHALFALRPREALWTRLRGLLRSRKTLLRIALAALVAGLLPVRLGVLVPAEVTPHDPFVVRAPLDGIVDRFQVQPNQAVAEGAPLFNLDTTALESRHATAREAYATAQEEYRQSAQLAVTDDKAKLEMAVQKGALDAKAVDLAYTASELDRVQVKAARAGVAVFSDVHEWIGRAVATGEKVLVLADPAKVELTARMPVADQIAVEPGAEIVFYPKAAPFSSYAAIVDSVAYHAEPTEQDVLAYRIRAHFKDGETPPRLGLMGSARLYAAGHVPLIYTLLRRPLAVVRQWLGW
jgi:multidrug efflux pump subunit AcrA (membrane-fusion protein)